MTPPPGPDAGPDADGAAGGIESLYPFLYAGTADRAADRAANTAAVLDQVRASTVAKIAEIAELRQAVAQRDAARLAECAAEAAARFAAGGRLFAFGNGGSATDAQQVATLFLNPGRDGWPGLAAAARVQPGQRHLRAHRAGQRRRRGGHVRPPAGRVRHQARHRGRPVHQRELGQPGPRLRRGRASRHAHDRAGRLRRRQDGRAGQHRLPVRRAVLLGAPHPGGPDHDLPRAVGADRDRRQQGAP